MSKTPKGPLPNPGRDDGDHLKPTDRNPKPDKMYPPKDPKKPSR